MNDNFDLSEKDYIDISKHPFIIAQNADLQPPSRVVCPECDKGTQHELKEYYEAIRDFPCPRCKGSGYVYKYYTIPEWQEWRRERGLSDVWEGAVHYYTFKNEWISTSNHQAFESVNINAVLVALNTPCPPNDYRHRSMT